MPLFAEVVKVVKPARTDTDASTDQIPARFSLSFAQEQELRYLRSGRRAVASLQASFRIDGPLDVMHLRDALHAVVIRHDALRLRVSEAEKEPEQWLAPPPPPEGILTCTLVKARSEEQFAVYASRLRARSLSTPWHLSRELPFRFQLLRYTPQLHALLVDFPRLTSDGQSRKVFTQDLWRAYAAHSGERPGAAPEPVGDLSRTISDQRTRSITRSRTVNRTYWERKLAVIREHEGHRGREESSKSGVSGGPAEPQTVALTNKIQLMGDHLADVRQHCRQHRCSPFQWIVSRFAHEIFRSERRRYLEISVPIDTRAPRDSILMGKFAMALPLLLERADDPDTILQHLKAEIMQTMRHRHVSDADMRAARAGLPADGTERRRGTVAVRSAQYDDEEAFPVTGTLHVTRAAFTPAVTYFSDGIDLAIEESPDRLSLVLHFDSRQYSKRDADTFAANLALGTRSCRDHPGGGQL
ncbi:condensation domain-containing protein [Streptomyces sp. TG1A-8]|uniref:condensation domain-containing protein n=1 Tax=Streptomyces sp. TG1A-8 TaxID=3051385 RepID=UPI00265C8B43|nr:condensation domain-containing protein [Streptomyces sp. TG1A-8]MDO0925021.1 condensation domain-containing protein [Streptomyces sp. TG1A-8]